MAVSRPSKCGCPQGHVGSNPTASAIEKVCNQADCRLFTFSQRFIRIISFSICLSRRDFLFYSLDAHDKVHIVKLSSLFSAYNKEYNRRMHPRFAPSFVRYSRAVLEQNSLAQSITLDIIFYRNIVIFKRWHYAETYKTDLSIFEYESNRVCKAT